MDKFRFHMFMKWQDTVSSYNKTHSNMICCSTFQYKIRNISAH